MNKKILVLFLFMAGGMLFTGCTKTIELTEEETNLIAEYSAELLLKYDMNYVDRIADGENELTKRFDEELDSGIKQESTTEKIKPESETPGADGGIADLPDMDVESGTESNIARLTGIDGVDITYKDYFLTDRYPEGGAEDEAVSLDAASGYQLLVLRFQVQNKTADRVSFSLLDKKVDYRIVCNGSHAANPMLTILVDDLGTLEASLEPNENQEAVLVFQIADSVKDSLESVKLKVGYNGGDNIINIL